MVSNTENNMTIQQASIIEAYDYTPEASQQHPFFQNLIKQNNDEYYQPLTRYLTLKASEGSHTKEEETEYSQLKNANISGNLNQTKKDVLRDFKICFPDHPSKKIDIPLLNGGTKTFSLEGENNHIVFNSEDEKNQYIDDVLAYLSTHEDKLDINQHVKVNTISQGHLIVPTQIIREHYRIITANEETDFFTPINFCQPYYSRHQDGSSKLNMDIIFPLLVDATDPSRVFYKMKGKNNIVSSSDSELVGLLLQVKAFPENQNINGTEVTVKNNLIKFKLNGKKMEIEPIMSVEGSVEFLKGKKSENYHIKLNAHVPEIINTDKSKPKPIISPKSQKIINKARGPKVGFFKKIADFFKNLFKRSKPKQGKVASSSELNPDAKLEKHRVSVESLPSETKIIPSPTSVAKTKIDNRESKFKRRQTLSPLSDLHSRTAQDLTPKSTTLNDTLSPAIIAQDQDLLNIVQHLNATEPLQSIPNYELYGILPGYKIRTITENNESIKQLELTFQGAESKKAILQQKINENGVSYKVEKTENLSSAELENLNRLCQLAVNNAKPNNKFNLSKTNENLKPHVVDFLKTAIEQAIKLNKFNSENQPIIVLTPKPRKSIMAPSA